MIKAGFIGFVWGEDDVWGKLEEAAKMGYKGMDMDASRLPGEGTIAEKAAKLRALGIEPLTCGLHNPDRSARGVTKDNKFITEVLDKAEAQGIKRLTLFGSSAIASFHGEPGTYDELMEDIDAINNIIKLAGERDMFLAYHNHWQEFGTYHKGVHPIDYMLMNCDPRFTMELDVGWVTVAGMDPVEVMRRFEGRIGAMHLKDIWDMEAAKHLGGYAPGEESSFTAMGTGVLDYVGVLKEMQRQGLDYAIVEQDRMRNLSKMDSLQLAYLNMKETGLVE